MSTVMLRDYPHLPLLTFEQSFAVFKLAKISFNMLSPLVGYSRMSIYLWRKGRNPHPIAADRVSTLAYKALAGLRAKSLPMPKRATLEQMLAALDAVDLSTMTAEQLLPANWLTQPTE
jgi:hypothetical protein